MSFLAKDIEPAFRGAGIKAGLEIWCIEKSGLVPIPKSSNGKFYSGSAYIILNTYILKNDTPHHEIHYWLGKDAKQEDCSLASDKSLELGASLESYAVQYREVQGVESEKFLSFFRPCIIPIEGVFSSGPGKKNDKPYIVTMLSCRGDHVVHVKEVPFSRSSLNHDDVFILDTASKVYLFSGCNSSTQERAKSLEVVQYIKETKHGGKCEVAIIEDGKLVGDSDVGEFWSLFGGYAPIPRDSPSTVPINPELCFPSIKLYLISTKGIITESGTSPLKKEMLNTSKCYMLDCDTEIFVWMGRNTSVSERKTSISATEEFLKTNGRSAGTHLTFSTEGSETANFRLYFGNWPQKVEPKLYEEGREKVAAIFKQRGYEVKEIPEEVYEPLIDLDGVLKVWRVNGDELSLVPVPEQTKFYSGDCYIVQYTYSSNARDEIMLYAWLGRASVEEDRVDAITQMESLAGSIKGQPVLAQVYESKEPLQFFSILKTLIVFKGGMSKRYKKFIQENNTTDDTYNEKETALFRVQGSSPKNMQVIQVDHVSSSLNSSYCYILQTGTTFYTWIGSLSSTRDHDLLDRTLDLIGPTWQPMSIREGNEGEIFWNVVGKKEEYPKEKVLSGYTEDPNLFTCKFVQDDLKMKEIFNFTQDDLTTEDVLVLNCHNEIYVWIGMHSTVKSKKQGFNLGLKFLKRDILDERLSMEIPIYIVTEGHEAPFFTHFFQWDPVKANMHGNSFERKLAILKGKPQIINTSSSRYLRKADNSIKDSSCSTGGGGLAKTASLPIVRQLFSTTDHIADDLLLLQVDNGEELPIYPYEHLKVMSNDPVLTTLLDTTKREAYLSKEDFEEKFKMSRTAFYRLPKWRQTKLKISLHLF